jgi:DNA-binding transcriptional MocR family regulator
MLDQSSLLLYGYKMVNSVEVIGTQLKARTGRALAEAVSNAIGSGLLEPDTKLPPIRTVAASLEMSPSTVSTAWNLLLRAGVIRTDGRRGTMVSSLARPGPTRYRRALQHESSMGLDLSSGIPDAALLPDLSAALRNLRPSWQQNYLDDPMLPELKDVLLSDWPYQPDRLTIVDGAMDAIDQVASHLIRIGDTVIVEHPTFPPFLDLLDALGARTIGVDVNDEGILPEQLEAALTTGAKTLLLQPRSHNPTGVSMSTPRAKALSAVLSSWSGWIIEDDSAGSISLRAPISLGQWLPDRTVHIRSFSKSHGPDLRLAAVSGPANLMDAIIERRMLGQGWTSRLLQSLLLDLLERPETIAQVSRAKTIYAERRAKVVAELSRLDVTTIGADGLNIWLPVEHETAAMLSLASRGVAVAAGGPFATKLDDVDHLRVTVSSVSQDFEALASNLRDASMAAPTWGPR